jgi:hypothetical protein
LFLDPGRFAPGGRLRSRRIAGIETVGVERLHHLRVHLTGQSEGLRSGTVPQARWLSGGRGAGVVTLPALGHRLGQVVGVMPDAPGQHELLLSVAGGPQGPAATPEDRDAMVCTALILLE